ncbi:MAG: 50S ribosomal protein L9 [Thermodesulfovibrionales bacterium]|nr:50S ribosomal protein L9 [Thermodesulfovibrionales bacterium]
MQVILKANVKNVGQIGEIVNVKDGFARNYLIPKGLAIEANTKNIRVLEFEKRKIEELAKKAKTAAENLVNKISNLNLIIKAKAGEEEKLFGSVTAIDISEALKKEGIEIDKRKILLEEPIKRLGSYTVTIKIQQDITAKLNFTVVSE